MARLSFSGAALFLILLILLHIIEPEFNPSWRMISEYELGRFGWMMRLAFISLSISTISSLAAFWPSASTIGGRVGLVFFAVIGLALIGAAVFKTDPITAPDNAKTTAGNRHTLCAFIVIPLFPIAVTLIGNSLARSPIYSQMRYWLPWMTILVWLGFIVFLASTIFYMRGKSGYGPDVWIGWPNRFMMATYTAWLLFMAWY